MSWQALLTLIVIAFSIVGLIRIRQAPELVLLAALALLTLTGALPLKQAFEGFANEGLIAVAALYVVAAGLRHTGAMEAPGRWLLGSPRGIVSAQLRLMLPTAAISAFMNNTPVVATLVPTVLDWAQRRGLSPSRLLMPLSYAAMLGGACTLIGTSTTVVINGLLLAEDPTQGMGFFTIGLIGLPVAIAGLLYLVIFGRRLLPDRSGPLANLTDPREYTAEMLVPEASPLAGKTLEQAGLRHLPGLYVIEIEREGEIIPAPEPQQTLKAGDRLVFAGIVESVADLQRTRGLIPATNQVFKLDTPRPERRLIEAVIAPGNPMVGKSVREGEFRSRYAAVVIAVARAGRRVHGKIGDIRLSAGDTLLLEAPPGFLARHRHHRDFLLLRPLAEPVVPHYERAWIAWSILGLMVGGVTSGLISLAPAALAAAVLMVATRCVDMRSARRAIELDVILLIGASLGLGAALEQTGAARAIMAPFLAFADSPLALLIAVYVLTVLLSAVISNNAAAVLVFPIAYVTATRMNVPFPPYALAIALAASASFATPIGYQTNLMVYGPGGYRFADFMRLGLPLNLIAGSVSIFLIQRLWLS